MITPMCGCVMIHDYQRHVRHVPLSLPNGGTRFEPNFQLASSCPVLYHYYLKDSQYGEDRRKAMQIICIRITRRPAGLEQNTPVTRTLRYCCAVSIHHRGLSSQATEPFTP